jgi:Ecdysteroid kinase-like family
MSLKPGSKVGDHYASVMFRLEVEVTTKASKSTESIALILKTMPFLEGKKMDLLKDGFMFDVEIKMYDSVLPAIKVLLEKCGIAQFWPDTVCQSHDPAPLLMFEDLSKEGYTVPKGFYDVDLSRRLLCSLAGQHAASFYIHHEQGHNFSEFNRSIFDMPEDFMKPIFDRHVGIFIDEVTKLPGFEGYHEKLKNFERKFLDHGSKTVKSIAGGYNVLTHGDFHHKNVLIQLSEDGNVVNDYKVVSFIIVVCRSNSNSSFSVGLPNLQLDLSSARPGLLYVHDDESGSPGPSS